MAKLKRDPVVPEMRHRLLANREGKLTPGQWLDLINQPLIILLLLTAVGFVLFSEYMLFILRRAWWIVLPVLVILVFIPVLTRAYRYARAPVHFARLYAGAQPLWGVKTQVFRTEAKQPVRFPRRLAPRMSLQMDVEYLVYYLEDAQGRVLLSAAPADHQDAEHWLPTKQFQARQERRRQT